MPSLWYGPSYARLSRGRSSHGFILQRLDRELLFHGLDATICYICGPPSFEKDIRCILKASGVSDQNIRSEVFSNSGVPVANDENGPISNSEQNLQPNLRDATVRFTKSGKSAAWTYKEDCSILELAEKTGLMPDYGCRAGVCGSCVATLGSGKVCGQGQRGDGTLLLCTAKPATGEVSIEI